MAKQYEVRILTKREDAANDYLQQAQAEGWQIAGNIILRQNPNADGVLFVSIPIKRLLKTKVKK